MKCARYLSCLIHNESGLLSTEYTKLLTLGTNTNPSKERREVTTYQMEREQVKQRVVVKNQKQAWVRMLENRRAIDVIYFYRHSLC